MAGRAVAVRVARTRSCRFPSAAAVRPSRASSSRSPASAAFAWWRPPSCLRSCSLPCLRWSSSRWRLRSSSQRCVRSPARSIFRSSSESCVRSCLLRSCWSPAVPAAVVLVAVVLAAVVLVAVVLVAVVLVAVVLVAVVRAVAAVAVAGVARLLRPVPAARVLRRHVAARVGPHPLHQRRDVPVPLERDHQEPLDRSVRRRPCLQPHQLGGHPVGDLLHRRAPRGVVRRHRRGRRAVVGREPPRLRDGIGARASGRPAAGPGRRRIGEPRVGRRGVHRRGHDGVRRRQRHRAGDAVAAVPAVTRRERDGRGRPARQQSAHGRVQPRVAQRAHPRSLLGQQVPDRPLRRPQPATMGRHVTSQRVDRQRRCVPGIHGA